MGVVLQSAYMTVFFVSLATVFFVSLVSMWRTVTRKNWVNREWKPNLPSKGRQFVYFTIYFQPKTLDSQYELSLDSDDLSPQCEPALRFLPTMCNQIQWIFQAKCNYSDKCFSSKRKYSKIFLNVQKKLPRLFSSLSDDRQNLDENYIYIYG